MKKTLCLTILTVSLLAFLPVVVFSHTCDAPFVTDLIAGGGNAASAFDVGDVEVCNDGPYLYVRYAITDQDWCLKETHVHAATSPDDIPQENGNPVPGQFDYSQQHDCVLEYTYQIPLNSEWSPGTELFIAAHAALERTNGYANPETIVQYESAWADGEQFPGANWGTYFRYTVQDVCECDLDGKDNCNILDWQIFIQDWGRRDCGTPPGSGYPPNDCECDIDRNGACNIVDYQLFLQDWGRDDCPNDSEILELVSLE